MEKEKSLNEKVKINEAKPFSVKDVASWATEETTLQVIPIEIQFLNIYVLPYLQQSIRRVIVVCSNVDQGFFAKISKIFSETRLRIMKYHMRPDHAWRGAMCTLDNLCAFTFLANESGDLKLSIFHINPHRENTGGVDSEAEHSWKSMKKYLPEAIAKMADHFFKTGEYCEEDIDPEHAKGEIVPRS